jgi:hypothetical protein
MAEQWEMILVDYDLGTMEFYSPKGFSRVKLKDFIESRNKQAANKEYNYPLTICLLLSEGWEPYYPQRFRRKYQGVDMSIKMALQI